MENLERRLAWTVSLASTTLSKKKKKKPARCICRSSLLKSPANIDSNTVVICYVSNGTNAEHSMHSVSARNNVYRLILII